MEPDALRAWFNRSPIRIHMDNGETYDIARPEFALVSDDSVALLTREDERMLKRLLPLSDISEVIERPESEE